MLIEMRRTSFLLAVAAAVGVAAACTGEEAVLVPSDPTDAGEDRAQPPDAADASDGGVAKDAGYCASRSGDAYCQDFDSLLDVKTLVPENSGKSSMFLTQAQFVSPNRAASFVLSTDEAPVPAFAVFKQPVPDDRPVRVEADMLFGVLDDTLQTLQSLTLARKNGQVQLGRACAPGDAGLVECAFFVAVCLFGVDGAPYATCTTHYVPKDAKAFATRDTWTHVALEATFAQTGGFALYLDAAKVLDLATPTYDVGKPPADAPTIVTVGVAALQGVPAVNLFVDNVAIMLR